MKYFLKGTIIIWLFFVSCFCIISTAETNSVDLDEETIIVDMGIMVYSDTVEKALTVQINNCTSEIKLVYIFSDVNNSAISIESSWYSPIYNQTTFVFKTNKVIPSWYFKNNTRQFVYIDNNTQILFRLYIDYSNILLPQNPIYGLLENNSILAENLTQIWEDYNHTYERFNITNEYLIQKWDLLNKTSKEFNKLNETVVQVKKDKKDIEFALLDEKNESKKYKNLYDDTNLKYSELEYKADEMEDALGRWPWVFICVVFLVGFFIFMYDRRKKIFKKKTSMRTEGIDGTGLTVKGRIINAIFSNKFSKKNKQETSNVENNVKNNIKKDGEDVKDFDAVPDKESLDEKIIKVDKRVEDLENREREDHQNLIKKIDKIISINKLKKIG